MEEGAECEPNQGGRNPSPWRVRKTMVGIEILKKKKKKKNHQKDTEPGGGSLLLHRQTACLPSRVRPRWRPPRAGVRDRVPRPPQTLI